MKTYLYRESNLQPLYWSQFHGRSQFLEPNKNRVSLQFIHNNDNQRDTLYVGLARAIPSH